MKEKALFDQVVEYYARHRYTGGSVSQEEFHAIVEAFKRQVAEDAIPYIEKAEFEEAKARVNAEVKAYKRKALRALKRSLIVEAIFVAFFVGVIVNQVTNIIPKLWYCCLGAILVSLIVCVLLVILGTMEPKE